MNKKLKNSTNPTLFVFEGSIRHYKDGTMLQLNSSITPAEWELIVEETIKYQVFLDCLKDIAFPILEEKWTKEDEWFRSQLNIAVSRMRNIDPLLMLKWKIEDIKNSYTTKMKTEAAAVKQMITEMKQQQASLGTKVSNL